VNDHEVLRMETGAFLRRAPRERGGPLPSIDVADALLDERRELTRAGAPSAVTLWATTG
jgi:hypothetical protein